MATCCEDDVTEDNTFICDGCNETKHLSCDKVNKGDVTQRKKSNRLRLFCTKCNERPGNILAENIKIIKSFVLKYDSVSQVNAMELKTANATLADKKARWQKV